MPYWYAATEYVPASINVVSAITSARRGSLQRDAILFKVLDLSGVNLTNVTPELSAMSGGGSVGSVVVYDTDIPGLYGIDMRLGQVAGINVIRIQAGSIVTTVSVTGQ